MSDNHMRLKLLFLFIMAQTVFLHTVNSQTLMQNAIRYVDSLIINSCLSWNTQHQNVSISNNNVILRVYDSCTCINIVTFPVGSIEITNLNEYYLDTALDKYEMTHMSSYYYEPVDILVLYWCNNIYSDNQDNYITCYIAFKKYGDYYSRKDYDLLIRLYFLDSTIIKHDFISILD